MNSSSAPKSWTKPNSTSAIESPDATAMLRLCEGIVRRAFSEPSIGSITTRAAPPSPKHDLAALLGDGDEGGALRGASASSSAKTSSSHWRSITRVWSPPSPTPS